MSTTPRHGLAVTAVGPFDPAAVRAADYCEIRADLWPGGPAEALAHIAASPRPVIFTCRSAAEGGACRVEDDERAAIFAQARERGAALIDIEMRSALFRRGVAAGWPVLASIHDFDGPIAAIEDRIVAAHGDGATAVKLVPTARSIADVVALKRALADPPPLPAALFAMGNCGIPSRILALTWGSFLSYLGAAAPAAPGQLTLPLYTELYGNARTFACHIALTGAEPDLWTAARLAQRSRTAPAMRRHTVPYPDAAPADFPAIIETLGARAVVDVQRLAGERWRCVVHRAHERPAAHSADTLDAALDAALNATR